MKKKEEKTIRIAVLNTNTFPISQKDATKYDVLKQEFLTNEADIVGLTELNYNWTRLDSTMQLHNQT